VFPPRSPRPRRGRFGQIVDRERAWNVAEKEVKAMKNIEAIVKPFKLDALKDRLRQAGAQGLTVSEVRGFGRTGGKKDVYRGSSYVVDFVPKIRIQIVAEDDMVQPIIEAIQATARTGEIGDGKIFVTPVVDAIRIRTGEHGHDAL
jgi:nitrogen regulatory protein P-II 1